jgi:molecular chaperone DnaK
VSAGNQILVRIDLDLSGILKVTATERLTGLARHITIESAMERFRKRERTDALGRLDEMFASAAAEAAAAGAPSAGFAPISSSDDAESLPPDLREAIARANDLLAKADRALTSANAEDASELSAMLTDMQRALERRSAPEIRKISEEMEDLVFYLQDA